MPAMGADHRIITVATTDRTQVQIPGPIPISFARACAVPEPGATVTFAGFVGTLRWSQNIGQGAKVYSTG